MPGAVHSAVMVGLKRESWKVRLVDGPYAGQILTHLYERVAVIPIGGENYQWVSTDAEGVLVYRHQTQ